MPKGLKVLHILLNSNRVYSPESIRGKSKANAGNKSNIYFGIFSGEMTLVNMQIVVESKWTMNAY